MTLQTDIFIQILLPIIITLIASSGFWLWIGKKTEKKSLETRLLIGIAHDRIVYLGTVYMTRGWISHDEYENLADYLYKPYADLGGNGTARRIMLEVEKLPIKTNRSLWTTEKGDGNEIPYVK